jgi:ATP-binding cassette subfamily B protein
VVKAVRRSVATFRVLIVTAWRSGPRAFITALCLQSVFALTGSLFPFPIRFAIDAVGKHDAKELTIAVGAAALLFALNWASSMPAGNSAGTVADRTNLYLSARIAELVNTTPTLEHFERPEYLVELELLARDRRMLGSAAATMLVLFQQLLRAAVMIVLLASINRYFLLFPLFGLAPVVADSFGTTHRKRTDDAQVEDIRLANDLFALASSADAAKELRLFGLTEEFLARHQQLTAGIIKRTTAAGLRASAGGLLGWTIFSVGFVGGVAILVDQTVHGRATVGEVVLAVGLVQLVWNQIAQLSSGSGGLAMARRTAERYLWLEAHAEAAVRESRSPEGSLPVPERIGDGIELDHVSFTYPGTSEVVLSDVTLFIPAGRSVAVVGENGAGKTTLMKLLLRMYEPTSGTIRIDDDELSRFEIDEWRGSCTATFQDFARFELRAGSTVGLGDLPQLDDDAAARSAIERSGGAELLSSLDEGLDTLLGRSFEGGRELSGGQWQKLAVARGRMRARPLLLVLDEPTASLDVQTEQALFEHYVQAAHEAGTSDGAITIIVSHRFSTVRMADLVVVIADGGIREFGSHDELIAANGLYAELFSLQARAYR